MEKLSEDLWIEIFNLLNSEDIEIAADICISWRNIITTTPSLNKKLTLRINFDDVEEKPWMKLPYKNLYLHRIYEKKRNKIEEMLQDIDYPDGVEKIVLNYENLTEIIPILNKFQNITTLIVLSMKDCVGIDEKINEIKIDLPNLTHLKIGMKAIELLCYIGCHKIEIFCAFYWETLPIEDENKKNFGKFLHSCTQLKHYMMLGFYTDEIMQIKSQLETFEITGHYTVIPSSFLKFLKSQKSSLKNLTLDVCEFDDEIANFIYFDMNLDKFVDYRWEHGEIYELKKVSLKNLALKTKIEFFNFEFFEKLFKCCEMLEVLSVELPGRKQLEFIGLLSKLPKLKYLKFEHDNSSKGFQQLTFKFNQLERLILSGGFTTDECVSVIRCCPNLTHLKINAPLTKNDFFHNISETCKNIQEIFLYQDEILYVGNFEVFKNIGLKIKLKIKTFDKHLIKKFLDAKNRLTAIYGGYPKRNPFYVYPRILSHLYYEI